MAKFKETIEVEIEISDEHVLAALGQVAKLDQSQIQNVVAPLLAAQFREAKGNITFQSPNTIIQHIPEQSHGETERKGYPRIRGGEAS